MSTSRLFQPVQLGRMTLQHRVIQPALTRNRVDKKTRIVGDDVVQHYAMRAAVPGTLLIAEATFMTPQSAALNNWQYTPGAWTADQIAGWKKVVDAVHARGSFIMLQLWVIGREVDPDILATLDPTFPYISASGIPVEGRSRPPRAITREEIQEYVQQFARVAKVAVEDADFDGIEINAAGGYLLDEFHKVFSNTRSDDYGGSPENRSRFTLEVMDAVAREIGEDRTALKLMPWDTTRGTGYENEDPVPTFSFLVAELRRRHPDLLFLHVIEPRWGNGWSGRTIKMHESNNFLREIWRGKKYVLDSGYTRESAIEQADADDDVLVAIGRYYTSNPDLPIRLQHNIPLTPYVRESFFAELDPVGYNTFKFTEDSKKILAKRGISVDDL